MNLVETRYIEIDGEKWPFRICMKARILYEDETGKSSFSVESTKDLLMLIYSCFKAGFSFEKKEFKITFDDFLSVVDNNPDILNVFQDDTPTVESNVKADPKKKQIK